MSKIRKDILTGQWVLFASNRHKKPYAYKHMHHVMDNMQDDCAFCPGKETETPKTKYAFPDEKNWQVRVFDNMYPAVNMIEFEEDSESFYPHYSGMGVHELLVDTPNHEKQTSDLDENEFFEVLKVLKDRYVLAKKTNGIKYVQIFKNNGPLAGASISHSHWQIIGIPIIPEEQESYTKAFAEHKKKTGRCIMCDMIEYEKEHKERIVDETEDFVSFAPYASRKSYEFWIAPKKHISSLEYIDENMLKNLSSFMLKMLKKADNLRPGVCYNIGFEDEIDGEEKGLHHWYIKIMPCLSAMAGLEFSTYCYINPVLPEVAAEKLRRL